MNRGNIIGLSCLVIASSHAIEVHNHSSLPALIDKITVTVDTGLDIQPSIKETNSTIAPGNQVNHQELTGQAHAIVRQIALQHNNVIYLFVVSPDQQKGSITINADGRISSSNGIDLTDQRSVVAPTRDRPVGPRMI